MKRRVLLILGAAVIIAAAAFTYKALGPKWYETGDPLLTDAAVDGQIALFGNDLSTDDLPSGWFHRTFWNVSSTSYVVEETDGRSALHCSTDNSGSILAREVSIPLSQFPFLRWEWKIEVPLNSDIDEKTHAGDDHPARFFLMYKSNDSKTFATEIIWSNTEFAPGEYKIIGDFVHLAANGLPENVGVWHEQKVDLAALYHRVSGRSDAAEIVVLGFFCDSDNTGGRTSAYFSNVRLETQ